jgi:hypothetical protein
MLDALREVRDNLTYARSEVYSAYEEVPDYDCNSSGRSYISQADSYLDRAADDLDKVIELLKGLEEGKYQLANPEDNGKGGIDLEIEEYNFDELEVGEEIPKPETIIMEGC